MRKWEKNFSESNPPKIAVVIASYNNPRALRLCLEGYARQSFLMEERQSFQVICADDGSSNPEVEKSFVEFADQTPLPCTFIQQDHRGWGKPRMLNWAILESKADWIIFTDGDCIPHRYFVKSHFEDSRENAVLCGRRVDVMEKLAPRLTVEEVRNGTLESYIWMAAQIVKDEFDFGTQGLYLPKALTGLIPLFSKNGSPTLLGSNFSMHKKRLMELNGFDESFATPGIGEDTDLERRIKLAGLKLEWITYRAIQFHLWHPLTIVGEATHKVFEELKKKGNKTAMKGLKELETILRPRK